MTTYDSYLGYFILYEFRVWHRVFCIHWVVLFISF